MKNTKQNNTYTPHERDYLEAKQKKIKAFSEKDYVELPDNITDPIVANNISNVEFDYTSDIYDKE